MQTSEEQLLAFRRHERLSFATNGLLPLLGDVNSFLISISNLTNGRFAERVDFGPAVMHEGTHSSRLKDRWAASSDPESSVPGRLVYLHPHVLGNRNPILQRRFFFIFGMPGGDYWIFGNFSRAVWRKTADSLAFM